MQTGQNLISLSHNAMGFPGDSYGKESACNMGDQGIQSLGQEDLLEKGMATHSSILVWRIPRMRSLECYSPWDHKELDSTE